MGLAAFEPSMTHSIEELMSRADAALYEQKRRKPARSVSSLAEAEIKQFSIV
jgi:predicted signal transduction protein with EAL and GGDEF domain